jgi:para-aminobenzoate synthetase component 2
VTRILVLDNYDSFTYNLVQYAQQLGAQTEVRRNDVVTAEQVVAGAPDGVLISPGPGTPEDAGISVPLVLACAEARIPLFGVCLGHQAIAVAYGATVGRAPELRHGKTSLVEHDGVGVLAGLPSPLSVTRYHSLAVEAATLPPTLEVTGRTSSGIVMALRHRTLPVEGVQFHPESVLTQGGHRMLATWLATCGLEAGDRVEALGADVELLRAAAFR